MKTSLAWEGFPPVYSHTSVAFLKNCSGFCAAKKGNMTAAASTVLKCVKPELIEKLRHDYPNATLLPVVAQNKLPEAFAEAIGLKIHKGVRAVHAEKRKRMSDMERLLHKPAFAGKVIKNKSYIIVDDVITQGGTVAALRKYILSRGGFVAAVAALCCTKGNHALAPDLSLLTKKFNPALIELVLKRFKIIEKLNELTNPQVMYLMRFKKLGHIVKKIACLQSLVKKSLIHHPSISIIPFSA